MIAPYFLPRRRVGALRPFKFAIHLRSQGWQPHVLTIKSPGQLTPRESQLLNEIPVYELVPPMDRTNQSESQQTEIDNSESGSSSSIAAVIDKNFPVDTWLPFFWLKWRAIKQYVNSLRPDVVWSTGDPWAAHWVGKKITQNYDIPWMADFRDPWTVSDTDLKKRSAFAARIDRWIERRWLRETSRVCFTSHHTRKNYEQAYEDLDLSTVTIYNAYDTSIEAESQASSVPDFDPDMLNLLFFGRFRELSSAQSWINILNQLKERDTKAFKKVMLHVFGPLTETDRRMASEKGVEDRFKIHRPVPPEQGRTILNRADLLLLSTNPGRKDIIPAKLWNYLAAEPPVLSIAPNNEIADILQETGAGVQFEMDAYEKVAKVLHKAVTAKGKGEAMPIANKRDKEKIQEYSAKATAKQLARNLDQLTN